MSTRADARLLPLNTPPSTFSSYKSLSTAAVSARGVTAKPGIVTQDVALAVSETPSPFMINNASVTIPPSLPCFAVEETPAPAANEITLTIPEMKITLTIPRGRSLAWVVSRLAQWFHNPTRGYTLGTFLLHTKPLTSEAVWKSVVSDDRITKLKLIQSSWGWGGAA
ncbi:hypothetical protein FN846DRAFT_924659 [Sphaerosporella brunnea]|uniref:Uncharacterized protein n=1 Tax=Sphaerosporella brunnea TaxID=1250544 RepID=A0A5J5FD38_9PEZI|nr:hypothetical protein FN846DRAFT_924659 [Sphaerosporella brunnea]